MHFEILSKAGVANADVFGQKLADVICERSLNSSLERKSDFLVNFLALNLQF